jgi:hypothetical protein
MIDSPLSVLDPRCPRKATLKNLIAEMYDYFTGELSLFQRHETGDLAGSITELADKILAADEAAQLKLELDWLAERGLDVDAGADSGVEAFFGVFNRHANLVRAVKLETVAAPVRSWRAGSSRLTSLPAAPETRERITRGGFTEEILAGGHFELMHSPLVTILAAGFAAALAETSPVRAGKLLAKP